MHKQPPSEQRYLRNQALARRLGITTMSLWRWKNDKSLNVPPASLINGREFNDVEAWDAWMRDRAVSRKAG